MKYIVYIVYIQLALYYLIQRLAAPTTKQSQLHPVTRTTPQLHARGENHVENKSGNKNQTWNACGAWFCFSRNVFIIIMNRIFQGEKTGDREQESTCVVG